MMDIAQPQKLTFSILCSGELKMFDTQSFESIHSTYYL